MLSFFFHKFGKQTFKKATKSLYYNQKGDAVYELSSLDAFILLSKVLHKNGHVIGCLYHHTSGIEYAVKVQRSLAPLSWFLVRMIKNVVDFRVMRTLCDRL